MRKNIDRVYADHKVKYGQNPSMAPLFVHQNFCRYNNLILGLTDLWNLSVVSYSKKNAALTNRIFSCPQLKAVVFSEHKTFCINAETK